MKIEEWNEIPKDEETDVIAEEGDLCTVIDGVAFLVQTKNGFNNIVCIRTAPATQSILKTFCDFRLWCEENKIQYFRVEGISHTYKMLYLVCKEGRKIGADCDVIFHYDESLYYESYVYYVKAY